MVRHETDFYTEIGRPMEDRSMTARSLNEIRRDEIGDDVRRGIPGEWDRLMKEIEALDQGLHDLGERLSPILTPQRTEPSEGNDETAVKMPEQFDSDFAVGIQRQQAKVRLMTARLRTLLGRIDL